MKKKKQYYKNIGRDPYNGKVEPERVIIKSCISINFSEFAKTPKEKELLKLAKLKHKESEQCLKH